MPQLPGRSRARKEILMTRERTLRGVRFHIHINSKRNADPLADFSGRQGLDLYLKCLQLILRHQIWFLVHEKGLPSELETVIFDLWALRITQLGDRIANDSHENESQTQVFNTLESEEDEITDHERGTISTPKGRDKKLHGAPNLYDCLVLCYLGILTLRLPITPGDIYAWVTDGRMAYSRAIKLLPLPMKDRLPSSYHAVLDPQTMLSYKRFYAALTNLEISFEKDHGILWPPLNVPLLLYRYIKDLALPLELYTATLQLGDMLGYDFAFHCHGRQRLGIRQLPEAQLIGCLATCVKLFYPFDKVRRNPESSSEPTAVVLDWKKWCEQMHAAKTIQRQGNSSFTTEELTKLQESDVFEMRHDQLDQYLKFYADTFLDDAEVQRSMDNDDFRNALYGMFPIDSRETYPPVQLSDGLPRDRVLETVRAVHGDMRTQAAIDSPQAEWTTLRPGQMYPVWKEVQDLPKRAKIFYEEVARLAGFSLDMLVTAVFFTEARIERLRRKHRKGVRAQGS
jgi:RNA polymerase I-specific transcription initiation factor RRN7